MNVASQYIASTTASVKTLFDASDMSCGWSVPMKAMATAPNVSTVGYHIVDSIHCRNMARNPVLGPKASPTQRKTPPCLSENMAASSAATSAVGIRKTTAAKR